MPENAIGKSGVGEILERAVVEGLRTVRRAQSVDLHDDESELGEIPHRVVHRERLRYEGALRAGVDVLDHGILLLRVEVARPEDNPPDVGLSVAGFRDEHLRRLPSRLGQCGDIALLELHYHRLIRRLSQLGDRRDVDLRIGIDVVIAVRRPDEGVIALRRREIDQAGSVEVDPVVVEQIRIFAGVASDRTSGPLASLTSLTLGGASARTSGPLASLTSLTLGVPSVTGEVDLARRRVHAIDIADDPVAPGDLVLHLARRAVIEVKVIPAVALRHPDDLVA